MERPLKRILRNLQRSAVYTFAHRWRRHAANLSAEYIAPISKEQFVIIPSHFLGAKLYGDLSPSP